MVDPDLQIRGGACHLDPDIRGELGLKKIFFGLFGLNIRRGGGGGGGGRLGPSPNDKTV